MHIQLNVLLAMATLTAAALAQFSHTIPNGTALRPGTGANGFPWGTTSINTVWAGVRIQSVYDSANFTAASISVPILIRRLRWRADDATGSWIGATYGNVDIRMSTAAVDWSAVTTNNATNSGADLVTVHSGQVTLMGGSSTDTQVGPTIVDIQLASPFLYDPNAGDLEIDVDITGGNPTAVVGQVKSPDVEGGSCLASRVWSSSQYPAANATTMNHGVIVTIDYVPAQGLYAYFSANVTGGATPLQVQFADHTHTSDPGGVTSWSWDLDGDSVADSTLQNPSFTYNNCGSYDVSLTVTDATHAPNTLTRSNYIVTDAVAADFTYQVLSYYQVAFTDTSTPVPTSWAWDFNNDNVVDSTSQNPVHVFPSTAIMAPVRLTASRLCGSPSTVTKPVLPTPGIMTTLSGGLELGSTGAGNCFDLTVINPLGINVTSLIVVPKANFAQPVTCSIYLTEAPGGWMANFANAAVWRLVGTGSGNAFVSSETLPVPCHMTLNRPFYIPPGNYAMAVHVGGNGIVFTRGNGINQSFSNADVALSLGNATAAPFNSSDIRPRVWNGVLFYDVCSMGGLAGQGYFGAGCQGTLGTPRLTSTGLPILGTVFTVNVNSMTNNSGMLVVGYSRTLSGYGPLPFDLTNFGLPGCFARVSTDIIVPIAGPGNAASLAIPVPNSPSLMCAQFYAQALVADPLANAFGGVVSDAMAVILGN